MLARDAVRRLFDAAVGAHRLQRDSFRGSRDKVGSTALGFQDHQGAPGSGRLVVLVVLIWLGLVAPVGAACTACTEYAAGIIWGSTSIGALSEASGLAASQRNPGVLWTHNDGSRKRVFAIATNGAPLSTFSFDFDVDDMEDIAVGPGPDPETSYLYLGDIGGNAHPGDTRDSVRILRAPEPPVQLPWATAPRSSDFSGVQHFTLRYPSGSFDAETLLIDPVNGDLFIVTKEDNSARVYRANLNDAVNGATLDLDFVVEVGFAKASGGDISADGGRIALRRENAALQWARCHNETIATALERRGQVIPVIGPPAEPNGEAIAFLGNGNGYVTISEGDDPFIHYFHLPCPEPLLIHIITAGTRLRIHFHAKTGHIYSLERRSSLTTSSWMYNDQSLEPAVDGPQYFEVGRSQDQTFYRVAVH